MFGMVVAQLRFRLGRAIALITALLVAVTSFSVLTATASTQRLAVQGTVNDNDRGAYDLLVRPAGSRSVLEARENLVSSTALTGLTGGITDAEWQKILAIPGVAVAAPVAAVGYALSTVDLTLDLSRDLDPTRAAQVLKLVTEQISEQGLTKIAAKGDYGNNSTYAYVTNQPMHSTESDLGPQPVEISTGGKAQQICQTPSVMVNNDGSNTEATTLSIICGSTNADNTYNAPGGANPNARGTGPATGTAAVDWSFPYLIEAIDPVQEAKLVGLNSAITKGTYFTAGQGPVVQAGTAGALFGMEGNDASVMTSVTKIPVLLANQTSVDEQLNVAVSRLPASAAAQIASGTDTLNLADTLPKMDGTPVTTITISAQQAYTQLLTSIEDVHDTNGYADLDMFLSALPIQYTDQGSALGVSPLARASDPLLPSATGIEMGIGDLANAGDLVDTLVRPVKLHTATPFGQAGGPTVGGAPRVSVVGEFDPSKISAVSTGLSAVPMETYFPAAASGADAASKAALNGKSLLPNGNIRGLLSVPPSMITTLSSLSVLDNPTVYDNSSLALGVDAAAPISVIRVKLSGALGVDALSRERVRLVAQRIHDETGLDVDVTMGSSPSPVTVTDPAGLFGRPTLHLSELWSRKGVAAVIVSAIDRKSLILFVLVLVVCGLFVAGATGAAVRSRRTELAVLACLGWPPRRLFALVLLEIGALGFAAGLVGAVLSVPIGHLLTVHVSFGRAMLAVPAALILALLSALWPAIQSSRSHPGAAVTAVVSGPKRPARLTGITRLSFANLRRVPGRAVLGITALAVGVCALDGLVGISAAFHGAVTGSLLGDAVSLQVRGTDYVAAGIAAALGAFTVVDVLYINVRERSAEYALMHATGWDDGAVTRLVLSEAATMAGIGVVVGSGLALAGITTFGGQFPSGLVTPTLAVGLGAIVLTVTAAIIPVMALRRTSTAQLLAEE